MKHKISSNKILIVIALFMLVLYLNSIKGYTTEVTLVEHNGHNCIATYIEPTCTLPGRIIYTCIECEDYIDTIITMPKLDHEYELTEDILPTCTDNGTKIYMCTKCNTQYIEKYGNKTEHIYSITPISTNHNKTDVMYICKYCGYKYYKTIKDSSTLTNNTPPSNPITVHNSNKMLPKSSNSNTHLKSSKTNIKEVVSTDNKQIYLNRKRTQNTISKYWNNNSKFFKVLTIIITACDIGVLGLYVILIIPLVKAAHFIIMKKRECKK